MRACVCVCVSVRLWVQICMRVCWRLVWHSAGKEFDVQSLSVCKAERFYKWNPAMHGALHIEVTPHVMETTSRLPKLQHFVLFCQKAHKNWACFKTKTTMGHLQCLPIVGAIRCVQCPQFITSRTLLDRVLLFGGFLKARHVSLLPHGPIKHDHKSWAQSIRDIEDSTTSSFLPHEKF